MITSRDNMLEYLHVMVSSWRSATLLARWRILICCAMAPLGCRQPSPRSVLREPVMRIPSIHSVGCSTLQYSFFTGTPSPLRNLCNPGQAPIDWHAGNGSTRTYFPGPDSHRCG